MFYQTIVELTGKANQELDEMVEDVHAKMKRIEFGDRSAQQYSSARMTAAVDRTRNVDDLLGESMETANDELRGTKSMTANIEKKANRIRDDAAQKVEKMHTDVEKEMEVAVKP